LCTASNVGAWIDTQHLPLSRGFCELAHALGRDPLALALSGGEDYELVYTLPPAATAPAFGTRIGCIDKRRRGVEVHDGAGRSVPIDARGYRHFA
jgi:thiamine-monophosphate kinase